MGRREILRTWWHTGRRRLPAALVVLALLSVATGALASDGSYQVIVHPENDLRTVDRTFLSRAFLKRTTRWPDGRLIRPVDLPADSATRRRFSEDALGRPVSAVRSYWQQLIFSGRGVPPPQLSDDRAVINYVLRHPGAIGYVSAQAEVGNAVVLTVR